MRAHRQTALPTGHEMDVQPVRRMYSLLDRCTRGSTRRTRRAILTSIPREFCFDAGEEYATTIMIASVTSKRGGRDLQDNGDRASGPEAVYASTLEG